MTEREAIVEQVIDNFLQSLHACPACYEYPLYNKEKQRYECINCHMPPDMQMHVPASLKYRPIGYRPLADQVMAVVATWVVLCGLFVIGVVLHFVL